MTVNDFTPGDVGINENGETVFCVEYVEGVPTPVDVLGRPGRGTVIRRLVIIDPEDREEVERLSEIANRWADRVPYSDMRKPGDIDHVEALQIALREFANSPTAEPTDPKARVVDSRDNYWRLLADGDWICVDGPDSGEYLPWTGLAGRGPLTVEGVSS